MQQARRNSNVYTGTRIEELHALLKGMRPRMREPSTCRSPAWLTPLFRISSIKGEKRPLQSWGDNLVTLKFLLMGNDPSAPRACLMTYTVEMRALSPNDHKYIRLVAPQQCIYLRTRLLSHFYGQSITYNIARSEPNEMQHLGEPQDELVHFLADPKKPSGMSEITPGRP